MWTIIGILIVLAVIGNLIKKKETPPTKSGSQSPPGFIRPEPLRPESDFLREAAQRRNLQVNLLAGVNKENPPPSRELNNIPASITMSEALAIIMHVVGFKDYMLMRYAITGLTHLAPAYMSDLHHAFMGNAFNR